MQETQNGTVILNSQDNPYQQNNPYHQDNGTVVLRPEDNPYLQSSMNNQQSYANNNGYQYPDQSINAFQSQVNNENASNAVSSDVSVKDWLLTDLILSIPLINVIMIFVWAFGGGTNKSKANFFRAQLLWLLILGLCAIVLLILFSGLLLALK